MPVVNVSVSRYRMNWRACNTRCSVFAACLSKEHLFLRLLAGQINFLCVKCGCVLAIVHIPGRAGLFACLLAEGRFHPPP